MHSQNYCCVLNSIYKRQPQQQDKIWYYNTRVKWNLDLQYGKHTTRKHLEKKIQKQKKYRQLQLELRDRRASSRLFLLHAQQAKNKEKMKLKRF